MLKKIFGAWNKFELLLLIISLFSVTLAFCLGEEKNFLSLFTSIFGIIGILCVAKGLIIGQYLSAIFLLLYAILSFFAAYYGECILSLGISFPSAITAIVTWMKNPTQDKSKVKINIISKKEWFFMAIGVLVVTVGAFFLLKALNTSELLVSTVSFITSLSAAYLLIRRSEYYAVFYILNDVVLTVLWSLALVKGQNVLPSIISYGAFLLNDTYGFFDWQRRSKLQNKEKSE